MTVATSTIPLSSITNSPSPKHSTNTMLPTKTTSFFLLSLFLAATNIGRNSALPIARSPTPSPQTTLYPTPRVRFYLSNVSAAYNTLEKPFQAHFFGSVRDIRASPAEQLPYAHPRVIAGPAEWAALISRHANPTNFNKPGSWSATLYKLTLNNGPLSAFVNHLAILEATNGTSAFTGASRASFPSEAAYDEYRMTLKPLADTLKMSNELYSHHLFLCAFWADVYQANDTNQIVPPTVRKTCIQAAVAWAKVLLAHRIFHCKATCKATTLGDDPEDRTYIWNHERLWYVTDDWHTSGASLALAYDVLYDSFTTREQTIIQSAIALLVMKRESWGSTVLSDAASPNAALEPHRIFSNWAMYSSNIYITNLAIEGEIGFVPYAREVLANHDSHGFNGGLSKRFEALIDAFFTHSIYPDGSSFEDGYTFHLALREGALGFVAYQRRGANIMNTARFRNSIHAVAQQWEPWTCAPFVGHASGGGLSYPTYIALYRYAYPNGILPRMLWSQRAGKVFDDNKCRIMWTQTMMQMTLFGDEHLEPEEKIAVAPAYLTEKFRKQFPLTYVMTRRGLVIMRGSHAERAAYMHLDVRPDSFFVGHDNADRGAITFSALKRRWLDDHDWRDNKDSRHHSLLHIDGLAQAVKAPSVTLLRATDDRNKSIASADLTYAYNVHWAQAWQGTNDGHGDEVEYDESGGTTVKQYHFLDDERNTPWDLGWPVEDDAKDLGFNRSMPLTRVTHIGFRGINEWRRAYRSEYLDHVTRSTIMVRSPTNDIGVGLMVDSAAATQGTHTFESYLVLSDEVRKEEGRCRKNRCMIRLSDGTGRLLDLHVVAKGKKVDHRVEEFNGHSRIVVRSSGRMNETFWMAMHAHEADVNGFHMIKAGENMMRVNYEGEDRFFRINRKKYNIVKEMRIGSN